MAAVSVVLAVVGFAGPIGGPLLIAVAGHGGGLGVGFARRPGADAEFGLSRQFAAR